MRAIHVQVKRADAARVLTLAAEHGGVSPVALPVERQQNAPGDAQDTALILATIPNERIGTFVDAVRHAVDAAEFVLTPAGVLPLVTPLDRLQNRVEDVSRLSTLELVLASLQSVGAWRGMLLYSALAGLIGGYGLIFDVVYLLVAAMLINPMGAPALVAVIALAIGDLRMFGRGALRFVASLAVQAAAALSLGMAYGLSVSTEMMELVTSLSTWAVLVAAAAGAAGAQTQVRSDRDSLVSGTAAGFMVAAALAPPAAVLGLSIPLGRWDYFGLMAFLLTLQFLAIGAGGWLVLRLSGVRPREPSVGRGEARWRNILAVGVLLAAAGLVFWQSRLEPRFMRADLSRTALEIARDAVDRVEGAHFIESAARFTRRDLERYEPETLLMQIYVERGNAAAADDELERAVRHHARDLIGERMHNVIGFVDVIVLPGAREQTAVEAPD